MPDDPAAAVLRLSREGRGVGAIAAATGLPVPGVLAVLARAGGAA